MIRDLMEKFIDPGTEYREMRFGVRNGELEPDELRQQINYMHEMGLGDFFMHSRVGLKTDYLSPKWFECIKVCIDETEKLGIEDFSKVIPSGNSLKIRRT